MKFIKPGIFFVFITVLTACGGSGGGNSNGGGAGGGGTNNSSSSAANNSEIVFGDSLNTNWGKFTAYEWSYTFNSGKGYDDGQSTNFLQWKIVQATAAEHNSVIEVSYPTQLPGWAQFYITSNPPADLSKYGSGKFSFDINVLDWGDAYDSSVGGAVYEVRIECVWPCASHPYNIVIDKTNEWKHVEINVADFANNGADLTKVDSTLLIKPLIGKQRGARYQLDNIKWTQGSTSIVKKKIIFEERFNTYASNIDWVFVPVNGVNDNFYSYVADGITISASTSGSSYVDWAIEKTITNPINIDHKNVSFQVNPDASLTSQAYLEMVATDTNGYQAYTAGIYLNSFTAKTWNKVSFNVDTAGVTADNLFNPAAVSKIKIIFHANGQPYMGSTGWLALDEIFITE